MGNTKIIATAEAQNTGETFETGVFANGHVFIADEPKEYGGTGMGPSPGDYICLALASCKAITIRMYAKRKKWDLGKISVRVNMVKGDQIASGLNTFYCEIKLSDNVSEEQQKRLLEISKVCPVDRLLSKPNDVVTLIE